MRPVTIFLLASNSPTASTMRPYQLIRQMDRTQVKTGGKMSAMQSSCFTPTILPISSSIFFFSVTQITVNLALCSLKMSVVLTLTVLLDTHGYSFLLWCSACRSGSPVKCLKIVLTIYGRKKNELFYCTRFIFILFHSHEPLQLSPYRQPFFCSIRSN